MRVPLQEWYDRWRESMEGTDLIYAHPEKPRLDQVHFVRDVLAWLLWKGVDYDQIPYHDGPRKDTKAIAWVVGEHRSKSVPLPVFEIANPALGLRLVLRYNFHDWNVSVVSERPLKLDLSEFPGAGLSEHDRKRHPDGVKPGSYWGYLFFQGFPDDVWFGPYEESDRRRFSLEVTNDYQLYAVVMQIARAARDAIAP